MTSGSGTPAVTSPVPRPVWESVLGSDPDAVVSQSLAWRDALFASQRYQDVSLLYELPTGARVILPMARRRHRPPWAAPTGSWPGPWGVGGPICEGGRISEAEAAAVLADVAQRGLLSVHIQLRHGDDSAWARSAQRFRATRHGCHVLDLDGGFGEVWQHRFRGTARTAIRKAERSGLDIEVDRSGRLLPVFSDLYEKSIQRWAAMQHEPLWLSRWRTLRATPAAMMAAVAWSFGDNCAVWLAQSAGVPVAGLIVLRHGPYVKYWRGAMKKEIAAPVRAKENLHRLVIEDACEQGYRYYEMGHSRPSSPLAAFKEKLGATLQVSHALQAERLPIHAAVEMSREMAKRMIGFRDV